MSKGIYTKGFTQNRELSWLRFNDRVLSEATDDTVPLLERLKFISIFTSNLDEFFMIRVGSLFDLMDVNDQSVDNRSGMTPKEQLDHIFEAVRPLYEKREQVMHQVEEQLRIYGIYHLQYSELEEKEKKYLKQYFKTSIEPVLSPQIIDTHHPFPHLVNKVIHVGVMLKRKNKGIFGVIPVPAVLPDIVLLPGNEVRYIRIENIISEFVDQIFDPYSVLEKVIFCVTRNADINPEDEAFDVEVDFRKKMKKVLGQRRRLAPVRLELSNPITESFSTYLQDKLSILPSQIYTSAAPLKLAYVFDLIGKIPETKRKILSYREFEPQIPPNINMKESITKQVLKSDILLSYPYESMKPFLQLLKEAAHDPAVISIKITIYRLASQAKLVEYLCAAAENGKDVTVIIELRARFDEQNNIDWSEHLEDAGCNIIYGFESYKVHSKICLITRREKNTIQYITQIGTGNYNEKTAKMYTDLSLLTANQDIGHDATEFFKNMSIGNLHGSYDHLLVAPVSLKPRVLELIDEEIVKGSSGKISIKINSLTDVDIIEKLAQASCAGVKIQMIIRGICCILPGIPDKTENIWISSIVGRFLEHSRIYCFGSGPAEKMFISSADFMTRNTERRVEVACPIYNEDVKAKIRKLFEMQVSDNKKARVLLPTGEYVKKEETQPVIDSQLVMMEMEQSTVEADVKKNAPPPHQWSAFQEKLQRLFHRKK